MKNNFVNICSDWASGADGRKSVLEWHWMRANGDGMGWNGQNGRHPGYLRGVKGRTYAGSAEMARNGLKMRIMSVRYRPKSGLDRMGNRARGGGMGWNGQNGRHPGCLMG